MPKFSSLQLLDFDKRIMSDRRRKKNCRHRDRKRCRSASPSIMPLRSRKRAKGNITKEQQQDLEMEVQILGLKVQLLTNQVHTLRTYIDDQLRIPMAQNSKSRWCNIM